MRSGKLGDGENRTDSKGINSESTFAKYQQATLNNLGYFGISRHAIFKNKHGSYTIRSTSTVAKFLFNFTLGNTLVKLVYILYLLYDKFLDLEFLDKMTAALYLLIFGIMTISYTIWFSRYPLFEIFYQAWNVEQSIYTSLGNPDELRITVDKQHKATVWVHLAITWIGCFCFLIQYYADPKYYTFTYAFVQDENWLLWTIFGAHEFLFMLHAWNLMTGSNSLFTFRGVVLFNIIDRMTDTVNRLSQKQGKLMLGNTSQDSDYQQDQMSSVKIMVPPAPISSTLRSAGYDNIEKIIFDYKQLMLISELYNQWVSYKTVFLHICGYCQFIADVFLAVQVLRLPQTGIMDIWFYIEDSLASMYMIYRVYNTISRVEPASTNFFTALQKFMEYPNSRRKYLIKIIKPLKLVSLKLGPCPVTRSTVLSAMEILGNYYVCVALW